jgi:carbonic anhydrase
MERLIYKKVNSTHYHSDSTIIWCFDARFSGLLTNLISKEKIKFPDIIKVAGGAKGLSSPGEKTEKRHLLSQIEKSIKLHKPCSVILMVHADCGAYGKKFLDSANEEEFYIKELERAESTLKKFLKNKKVRAKIVKYFADFKGLIRI